MSRNVNIDYNDFEENIERYTGELGRIHVRVRFYKEPNYG